MTLTDWLDALAFGGLFGYLLPTAAIWLDSRHDNPFDVFDV